MVIAVLAVGALGFLLLSTDRDGPDVPQATVQDTEDRTASEQAPEPAPGSPDSPEPGDVEPDQGADDSEPPETSSGDADASEEAGSGSDDHAEPESSAAETAALPELSGDELVTTVDRYVRALDAGRWAEAHDVLSPAMQGRSGWSLDEFSSFWTGYLVAARLIDVEQVDVDLGEVVVTIDYELVGNGLSREQIRLGIVPDLDGAGVIDGYEVLRADRLR